MMKYVTYTLVAIIAYLVIFRMIVPKLISTNSDAAVLTGAVIVVVAVYYAIYAVYEHIKNKE
jgi:protein-S-isoprenylcysteine O-methyltransferase Ste14